MSSLYIPSVEELLAIPGRAEWDWLNDYFVHFHRHSEFSPLDGTGNATQYAEMAALILKHRALGLTDHAVLGGALDHVRACQCDADLLKGSSHLVDIDSELRPGEKRSREERIKPIVGVEVFWAGGGEELDFWRSRTDKGYDHNEKPHLCLHASGITGFQNLIAIVTESNRTGFHGVPRVDFELLNSHSDGIVVSTACLSSPVCRALKAGDYDRSVRFVRDLMKAVDGRVWVEIMGHDVDDQRFVNPGLIQIANELGLGLIATADAHYPFATWGDTQEIVFALARKDTLKKRAEKEEAARITGDEVYGKNLGSAYLMHAAEMVQLFGKHHPDIPQSIVVEAIKNTGTLAAQIKPYIVSKDLKVPKAAGTEEAAEKLLRKWVEEGFEREKKRRLNFAVEHEQAYRDQLEFELTVLRDKGVMDYFVLVGDFVRWARSDLPMPTRDENGELHYDGPRKRPRPVGPGRGSAAGCLLSYLIGITGMDPMPYGLLFERFLNPDRKGLPDIDIDFRSADRDLMVEYLSVVYGEENVAHVITYQTFGPRAAIGDLTKYHDSGENKVEFMDSQRVKDSFGNLDKDLLKLYKDNQELQKWAEKYPEVWKHAIRIDDMVKAPSKHASAILITPKPIHHYGPLQRSKGKAKDGSDDKFVFAWADRAAFPVVSEYGYFKVDVLGLEELDRHDYALDLIEERTGQRPDIYGLPIMWDPNAAEEAVMENFKAGMTLGVFQFGGGGFTQLIRAIRPDTVLDLAAANALYRPGAMEFAFEFAKKKKGEQEVTYWHELVVPFLRETFGLVAYQEQVMQICKAMGEFSPGQADDMRKAMSKLYRLPGDEAQRFMERFRSQWDAGCANNGISDEVRDTVWQSILKWGGYGFNKSHSACYALLAYIDMWLKTNYPHEFYAALLTHRGKLEVKDIVREAAQMGVQILRPHINKSARGFTIEDDGEHSGLRYGLVSVANIGGAAANAIERERPYENFEDFLRKQKPDDDAGEDQTSFSISDALNLVKAGAFDELNDRYDLLRYVPKVFGGETTVYDITMACGCELRGRKFDPVNDPYQLDENGEIIRFKSGQKKGQPKYRGKMPECKNHGVEDIKSVESRQELWHYANHLHKNLSLRVPNAVPEGGHQPAMKEVSAWEREVLGLSLSDVDIADKVQEILPEFEFDYSTELVQSEADLEGIPEKRRVYTGGELVDYRPMKIKNGQNKGKDMARFKVAVGNGDAIPCTMFSEGYERMKDTLESSQFILVQGKKNEWNGSSSIVVQFVDDAEQFVEEAKREEV